MFPPHTHATRLLIITVAYFPLVCIALCLAPFMLVAPFLPHRYWDRVRLLFRECRAWSRDILASLEIEHAAETYVGSQLLRRVGLFRNRVVFRTDRFQTTRTRVDLS